jgi:hypothetical protein
MIYVAVCGPDPCSAAEARGAEEVGRRLAEAGAVVVCGGHGGVMEAAAKGASTAGGTVVGILPGSSRSEGNAFLTVAIPTGLGELRNGLIVRAAEVVIAVGGAFGTLSEIALALKTGVPLVGLGTWRLARDDSPFTDPIVRAASPEEAVRRALELAQSR